MCIEAMTLISSAGRVVTLKRTYYKTYMISNILNSLLVACKIFAFCIIVFLQAIYDPRASSSAFPVSDDPSPSKHEEKAIHYLVWAGQPML